MATHFFGITDRTFAYSFSIGRNEFGGTGFRNPVGLAVNGETIYVANRSYENRPDGVRITVCTYNEDFIGEFGAAGEGEDDELPPPQSARSDEVYSATSCR